MNLNAQDPMQTALEKPNVGNEFKCQGSNANCIGKTERCLHTRVKEHFSQATSEIYNHIITCNEFNSIKNITPDDDTN